MQVKAYSKTTKKTGCKDMSPLIVSDDEVGGKSPTEAEYHSSILNIVTCIECLLSWHG